MEDTAGRNSTIALSSNFVSPSPTKKIENETYLTEPKEFKIVPLTIAARQVSAYNQSEKID